MKTRTTATRADGDEGFALMTVLAGMLALTAVVLATTAYVVNSLPITRATQDATAAVQAAQAGIDDYLGRLAACDSYWKAPCSGSVANAALTGWAPLPNSSGTGTGPAEYHLDVLVTPDTKAGLLRVRSTGRVRGRTEVTRSLVVDLKKKSFLDYIYYTDKEASAPALIKRQRGSSRVYPLDPSNNGGYNAYRYVGVQDSQAERCNRYWYARAPLEPRNQSYSEPIQLSKDGGKNWLNYSQQNYSCNIQFASIDTIDGPLHTNDAMLIYGALFKGPTTTSWWRGTVPDPSGDAQYLGSGPDTSGQKPIEGERVELPPSNTILKDRTDPAKGGQDGCIYSGPTSIQLLSNGKMRVQSPRTTATNAGCTTNTPTAPNLGTAQDVNLPANGVVYVQRSTGSCTTHPLGYPKNGDLTPYDCAAGDAFVSGDLKGRLTIGTENDIVITKDLRYVGAANADSLGLIANDFVTVYHPVRCSSTPANGFTCPDDDIRNIDVGIKDISISAAILSVRNSFTVQNFDKGDKLGTLTVAGGIYQAFRGPVGTGGGGGGSGYAKNYVYDKNLKSLPPPSFLDPASAPWGPSGYAEVKPPADLP